MTQPPRNDEGEVLIKMRPGMSPMQMTTMVATTGFGDTDRALQRRHRGKQKAAPGKPKHAKGDKAKRKAAAKSRARNRK